MLFAQHQQLNSMLKKKENTKEFFFADHFIVIFTTKAGKFIKITKSVLGFPKQSHYHGCHAKWTYRT
jgi:hypothetical protein